MIFNWKYGLILLLIIGSLSAEFQYVCEVCHCDEIDQPKSVNCDGLQLTNLTNLFFNGTIEKLTLVNNSLTLHSDDEIQLLNNLTSLKYLDLSKNPLTKIPSLLFENLEYLNLEETELTTISFPQTFENSTKLQSLILSKNKITKINANDLKYFPSLKKLSLDIDQLMSIDRQTLVSAKNSIESISLRSNFLQTSEFLSNLSNLFSIDLDENHLKHFPKELLNASRLGYVSLRNNQIEIIDEFSPLFHWTKTNLSDIEVYLNSNPFDCCQSRWFVHYLSGPKNFVKDSINLTCASPKSYAGQRLIDLHADLMDCSNEPFHPSNSHWKKSTIVLLSFLIIATVIFIVIGLNLYRRGRCPFRNRSHAYEPIAGDNLPSSM